MRALAATGLLIASALVLHGCAIAPGMTMTEPAEVPDGHVIRVTPITLELVNRMASEHELQARRVAEEFVVQSPCSAMSASAVTA